MDELIKRKIRYLADITGLKYSTVENLVQRKKEELEFLINDSAAVHIIASNLKVKLPLKLDD